MVYCCCLGGRSSGECLRLHLCETSLLPIFNHPYFPVDVWLPEGTDIRATNDTLKELEGWLAEQDHVEHITTTAGKGLQRFMLTYAPEKATRLMVRSLRVSRTTKR